MEFVTWGLGPTQQPHRPRPLPCSSKKAKEGLGAMSLATISASTNWYRHRQGLVR